MIVRTLISALTIVVGALMIAAWAVGQMVVSAVTDGTAIEALTATVLDSPTALTRISSDLGDAAMTKVATEWPGAEALGVEVPIRGAISGLVHSDEFASTVQTQVGLARVQVAHELTDETRESGPLVLDLDVSSMINARIGAIPRVGGFAPDVALAPVPVEVVSAKTFDDARAAYGFLNFAATWFLWAGIALLVLGVVISARRRWFLAKALLAVGVFLFVAGAVLWLAGPTTVAGWIPGGSGGDTRAIIIGSLASESTPSMSGRMMWWGVIGLVGSAVFALLAAAMGRKKA